MAVHRRLRDGPGFEPEAVHALVLACEDLLRDLQLTDRNDPFTEIVARAVIEAARLGERDPAEIHNGVLRETAKRTSRRPPSPSRVRLRNNPQGTGIL